MQNCPQTETQSVYQHGQSVRDYFLQLLTFLRTNEIGNDWKLPDWITTYQQELLIALLPIDIIETYILFHDVGKIDCLIYDQEGKRHFPDHSRRSSEKWLEIGGEEQVAKLIGLNSTSFKIKWKQIDRRGRPICRLLFGEKS